MTGQPEPDEALVEAVATAVHDTWCQPACGVPGHAYISGRISPDEARAAIAAVRAYDLARQPYAVTTDGRITLHWPDGRPGDAIWCSTALIEALIAGAPPPAELQAVIVDGVPVPASPGVPVCRGLVWGPDAPSGLCTLPLGHHGGCR